MKKLLLSLSLVLAFGSTQAQNLITENFDVFPAAWTQTNQSAPVGASTWAQGGGTAFTPGGYNGGATSFALVNYNSTGNNGDISNWLITPIISLQNGDVVSFYTRQGGTAVSYADNMEVRISTNGGFTANPSGVEDVGDFSTLVVAINPEEAADGYPLTWTQYTYTVTGLPTATDCKVAFRYYIHDGGFLGTNSNIIGIDAFSVDRPLSTANFFASNFAVYPNPASNVLNIDAKNSGSINEMQLTDLNGRIVKSVKTTSVNNAQINIADLNAGVYFLKVTSNEGTGTTKVVKN
jgi:hypothetical protein